jgi:putative aldouronate transport system substrate-binding protein
MKKWVVLLMALAMVGTSFAAQAAEITYPLSAEKVTMTVAIPKQAVHTSESDLYIWQKLEELTNVHVEFVEIPEENITELVSLMFATNDYPEVFWGGLINQSQEAIYGPMGVLLPLDDLIAENAPHIQEMLDTEDFVYALSAIDGALYSVPRVDHNPGNYAWSKFWINEEWLWKLDMDVPTTPDAFRAYLEGVRDEDVNGDGDASDEIPLMATNTVHLGALFGPWGVVDNQNHMMVEDGKLVFVPTQDGFRNALTYFAGLYADGLLWNETFTATYEQMVAIAQDSPIKVGAAVNDGLTGLAGQQYFFNYSIMRPLEAEDGSKLWPNGTSPSVATGYFAITDKCKDPALAIKWADYFLTMQGTLEFYRGIEGETWKWNEDDTYVHLSVPAELGIDQNTWVASQRYGGAALGYFSKALRARNVADMSLLNGQTGQKQWRQTAMYTQYQPEEYVPQLVFTAEELEELSYIRDTIFNYVTEMEAKFITGQESLDDWDAYVNTLSNMELEKLMTIYQTAYDRMINQ